MSDQNPPNPYGNPFDPSQNNGAENDSTGWSSPLPPPPNYSQQSYYQGPGRGAPLRPHPESSTVLVMGLLSLLLCSLLGPFTWAKGNKVRKEIKASPGVYNEDASVTAGWILGIIASGMLAIVVLMVGAFFVLVAIAGPEIESELEKEMDKEMTSYCEEVNVSDAECDSYYRT